MIQKAKELKTSLKEERKDAAKEVRRVTKFNEEYFIPPMKKATYLEKANDFDKMQELIDLHQRNSVV